MQETRYLILMIITHFTPYYICMCVYIYICVCVCAQLCLTLCNPMDCILPDSSVHGISQARILEWVAISSNIAIINTLKS